MIAIKKIPTSPDLTFDVMVCGDEDAPLVLLLHGFADRSLCGVVRLELSLF